MPDPIIDQTYDSRDADGALTPEAMAHRAEIMQWARDQGHEAALFPDVLVHWLAAERVRFDALHEQQKAAAAGESVSSDKPAPEPTAPAAAPASTASASTPSEPASGGASSAEDTSAAVPDTSAEA